MHFTPIKIDYSFDDEGKLTIIDIGDGRSCGDNGFPNLDQAIEKKVFSIAPDSLTKVILEGEVPEEALSHNQHPIVFSSFNSAKHTIWPMSKMNRNLSISLHTHGHYHLSKNIHPSTLIVSEQHKLYLYILRDLLPEAKHFVFWHPKQPIDQAIQAISTLNIPTEQGFFIKAMDNSNGGARPDEIIYVKSIKALTSTLNEIKSESIKTDQYLSYAIEQAFSHRKKIRNGKEYVVTGRAFIMLTQTTNSDIKAEIIDAKYMFPSLPHQGANKGSTDQFLANLNRGQSTLLPLTTKELDQLNEQLNADRLKPLWQGLFQPLSETDKVFLAKDIPIHKKFLQDCAKRPYQKNKIDQIEKTSKPTVSVKYINDPYFTYSLGMLDVDRTIKQYSLGIEGHNTKENIATLSRALGLIQCHLRMEKTLQKMGQDHYLNQIRDPRNPQMLRQGLNTNLRRLLTQHNNIQTRNLQSIANELTTQPTKSNSTNKPITCSTDTNEQTHAHCPSLNIHPGEPFYYTKDYPTALAQAAYLSDVTILRALLLSRVVSISTPAEYGEHAFFYALSCFESGTTSAARQILYAAIRDKQDQWNIPDSESTKETHLEAIYDCLFFEKLAHYFKNQTELPSDSALVKWDTLMESTCYREHIRQQTRLYLLACKIKPYSFDNPNKTLRNAVVQADFETSRMLILTGLADPLDVSTSGKTATDHADERSKTAHATEKTTRLRIQSFIHHINSKLKKDGKHEQNPVQARPNEDISSAPTSVQTLSFFETIDSTDSKASHRP